MAAFECISFMEICELFIFLEGTAAHASLFNDLLSNYHDGNFAFKGLIIMVKKTFFKVKEPERFECVMVFSFLGSIK